MKIALILTARPSWAKLESVAHALRARGADFAIIACASALLERYGRVVDLVRQDYPVCEEVYSVYEGSTHRTDAAEQGALTTALSATLSRLQPSAVVLCADRREVLAAATAAATLHLPIVHLQGGERTGSIDDKCRNAITQLADVHCVATELAALRVWNFTGSAAIYQTGCPSIDLARKALSAPAVTDDELGGTGGRLDLSKPFQLILFHPVTSEADRAYDQMWTLLEAAGQVNTPRVCLWPGEDAGAAAISKAIRAWRLHHPERTFRTVRNLPPVRFLRLLSQAAVLVGNSSAGIREASYLGTPVVNVGSRQTGRERGRNVTDCPTFYGLRDLIVQQIMQGRSASSLLYGNGTAGEQIAEVLCKRPS